MPDLAIIGILPRVSTVRFWASTPDKTRSIRSPLIGIWRTLAPSLKTSRAEENSLTVIPARARAVVFGVIRTCGEPASRDGRSLIWFPLDLGNFWLSSESRFLTIGSIRSKLGPVTSTRIDLLPPTERPNNDAWLTKALAPGSLNTGLINTIFNSATLELSLAEAPAKAPPWKATKKNLSISGGPPSFVLPSHKGLAAFSIFSAIRSVSSIE